MLCETFTPENANSFQEFLCLGAVLTISRSLTTALVIEPRDYKTREREVTLIHMPCEGLKVVTEPAFPSLVFLNEFHELYP
ncbi:hypothetical protein QQP08_013538 [Theobroma cacao]|nr:hypothetical protein QQP08_013538 [Theobroma cacao]